MGIKSPSPKRLLNLRPRSRRAGPLLLALAVQFALLSLTIFVVVIIPPSREEPEFTAAKTIYLPQRELEHRVALAEFQQTVSAPPALEKLATAALLPDGLPPLPAIPRSDSDPAESLLPADAHALLGQSGLLGLAQNSTQSAASFFGIEDTGQRIVIVVNTSVSVVKKAERRGVSIDRIQQEMLSLIDSLDSHALFGIVQFSQGVRIFENFLAPATAANKQAVHEWVPANLRGNPVAQPNQRYYGHEAAFEAAFSLEPDLIFLVTDGQLNRRQGTPGNYSYPEIPYDHFTRTILQLQQQHSISPRIHAVAFEMKPKDAAALRTFTRTFQGQLREF